MGKIRHWRSREQEAQAKGLEKPQAELPDLLCRFLQARQIVSPEQITSLLNSKIQELKDPFSILGMKRGAERLVQAFANKEKVCVYGDFDLDGTSGLALLWEGLEKLGFQDLQGYQPKRLAEGYGFHSSVVEDLYQQGVKVIITVDVGITAHAACAKAKELGLDVVLTDHHLPAETLPEAYVVINPNQKLDQSGLGYLCGAGVAFYFLRALKRLLVDAGLKQDSDLPLKPLLDYLTIATLTDMVPLVGDNRALVKLGLQVLSQTNRPGLLSLLQQLKLSGKPLTSQDVAIKFAPKLNALSRMETGLRPIDLFRAPDLDSAEEMVHQVLENNSARAQFQSQGEEQAVQMLSSWNKKDFVFLVSASFHRGVVGLIATKLAALTNLPTFIGAMGSDGVVVGSGRLPPGSDLSLLDALSAADKYLNRFGGHSAAAGFEFHFDRFQDLVEAIANHYIVSENEPLPLIVDYDLDVGLSDLTAHHLRSFDELGPFGQGFSVPLFKVHGVTPLDVRVLKGGHLKLSFESSSQKQKPIEALYFSPPTRFAGGEQLKNTPLDLLAELQWNDFAGVRSLQLNIKELSLNQKESK